MAIRAPDGANNINIAWKNLTLSYFILSLYIPAMMCFTRPFRELNLSVPAGRSFCEPAELRDAMSCQF